MLRIAIVMTLLGAPLFCCWLFAGSKFGQRSNGVKKVRRARAIRVILG
jgi:hypothetical protein